LENKDLFEWEDLQGKSPTVNKLESIVFVDSELGLFGCFSKNRFVADIYGV
jgi:hypothetical protein